MLVQYHLRFTSHCSSCPDPDTLSTAPHVGSCGRQFSAHEYEQTKAKQEAQDQQAGVVVQLPIEKSIKHRSSCPDFETLGPRASCTTST